MQNTRLFKTPDLQKITEIGATSNQNIELTGTSQIFKIESVTDSTSPVVSIKQSPSTNTTNVIMQLEADGANWTGGYILKIISDDNDIVPFAINNGSGDVFQINRSGSLSIYGDIVLSFGGSITSSVNGNIVSLPNGSGITVVGDAGSTSHTLNTNDDMFIAGRLEVDGFSYFDATINTASIVLNSGAKIMSDATYGTIYPALTSQTIRPLFIGVGSVSRHILIGEEADATYNFGHSQTTDPTIFLHSANQSTTEYISFSHNQTNGVIGVGAGGIQLPSTVGIGAAPNSNTSLLIDGGVLTLKETTTPTAIANHISIYSKSDHKLYFQDGAGVEHEVQLVA